MYKMFSKSKKIDLSFLQYITDEDINSPQITIEQIKKRFPFIAKNNLECFKFFLILNNDILSEEEKREVVKTIDYLQKFEESKFKLAFQYIEECQKPQKLTQE